MTHACRLQPTAWAVLAAAALLPAAPAHADNCEPIRAAIEAKMRAGGLPNPQLLVVDAGATAPGRVVGNCGNGTRKIVHTGAGPGATATTSADARAAAPVEAARPKPRPAASQDDQIPTECRDGTVVLGPNCNNPRAPRLPAVDTAAPAAPASTAAPRAKVASAP